MTRVVISIAIVEANHQHSGRTKAEAHLSNPVCFTDSKVALYWIQGVKHEWKQFDENGVATIRNLVELSTALGERTQRTYTIKRFGCVSTRQHGTLAGWSRLALPQE